MADNVKITEAGTGTSVAADELTDGTLGSVKVQYIKLMDGSLGGSNKAIVTNRAQPADTGLVVKQTPYTYETVAPNVVTPQVIGSTGATGDYIAGVLIVPESTSPGGVALVDGSTTITLFVGGASSVVDLKPFYVQLGMVSATGPWKLGTGANVRCIAVGSFT